MKVYKNPRNRILMLVGCAFVGGVPAAASGQVAGDASAAGSGGNDIVVTAQRRSQRAEDVPISLVVRSGDELAATGVNNVKDLQLVVPGLTSASTAFFQPSIRGVTTQVSDAGGEAPVGVYVDGVYQANMLANVSDFPDIDRVEVLKGPQGTLFGRSNTAGAILIYTIKPSFTTTGSATLSYGRFTGGKSRSAGDSIAKGYLSGPVISDLMAVSAAGFYERIGKYFTDDRTGKRSGGAERYLIRGKILLQPAPNLSFILTGLYSHVDDNIGITLQPLPGTAASSANPQPGDVIPTQKYHIAAENPGGTSPTRVRVKQVSLQGSLDLDAGSISSTTAYTKVKAYTLADLDGTYSPSCRASLACISYGVIFPSKTFQQELLFSSHKFGAFSFVAGAFYFQDTSSNGNVVNPVLLPDGTPDPSGAAALSYKGTIKTKSIAGFGEATMQATDALQFAAGVRYTWEKKTGLSFFPGVAPVAIPPGGLPHVHAWTPRFSIRYEIMPGANIYATYAKGQKSGVISSSSPGQFALPEKLTSYEVGLKIGRRHFTFNIDAFYYDYKDLQEQITRTAAVLSNAANAQLFGVEADTSIRLGHGLAFQAGGSYLPRARYKDYTEAPAVGGGSFDASGLRMIRAPKFSGNTGMSYEGDSSLGKIDGAVTLFYSSAYYWDITKLIQTKAFVTLNAQAGVTLPHSRMRIGVFAKNLTNSSQIAAALQSSSALAVRYAEPRQVGISLGAAF